MPNQNDPTQNPNPVPPSVFPQSDLPPLPPEFQNLPKNDVPATAPIDSHAASSAPPNFSPITSKPKKKFGGGKIIATILGLIILVGGVGAGIMLTQQKQLVNQKAATTACTNAGSTENCYGKNVGDTCTGGVGTCNLNGNGIGCSCNTGGGSGGEVANCSGNTCSVGGFYDANSCYVVHFGCNTIGGKDINGNWLGCNDWIIATKVQSATFNQTCGGEQIDVVCAAHTIPGEPFISTGHTSPCNGQPTAIPTTQPTNNPTASPTASPSPTPTVTPTPTPTPTETPIVPSCIAVKAYDSEWTFIPETQLPSLTVGNVVNFCVGGSAPAGTFDKAQFMINSVLKAETTDPRPGTNDFCQTYTILSTDTTVNVKAKIHHSTGGWVGENI